MSELSGSVAWRSPSNIALIKYWGKRPVQITQNASISFTLTNSHTDTRVKYEQLDSGDGPEVVFFFEGKKETSFATRIIKYLQSIKGHLPFLNHVKLTIESSNSFPHSSGIASSASSMSALALCLCEIEQRIEGIEGKSESLWKKASFLARLGSGSACRSVFPGMAAWGTTNHIAGSTNDRAIQVKGCDPIFYEFHDDVLIVSEEKKSVSSSAGHALMDTNPFAQVRYQQADQNMEMLLAAMKEGNLELFGQIVEDEALTLHALMMCSNPSYLLMKPGTLTAINQIREFRASSGVPVYFTLDAGPNVHILYPNHAKNEVQTFLENIVLAQSSQLRVISDRVGPGPINLLS